MNDSAHEQKTQRKKIHPTWYWLFWIAGFICLTILILAPRQFANYAKFDKAVQRVLDAKHPANFEELVNYVKIPSGAVDLTQNYLELLESVEQAHGSSWRKIAVDLPSKPKATPIQFPLTFDDVPLDNAPWDLSEKCDAYLQQVEPSLAKLVSLTEQPGTVRYPFDNEPLELYKLPYLRQIRLASRMLVMKTLLEIRRNQPEEALDSLHAVLRLAATLQNQPLHDSQLSYCGHTQSVLHAVGKLLEYTRPQDASMLRIQEALGKVDYLASYKLAVIGERAILLHGISDSSDMTQALPYGDIESYFVSPTRNVSRFRPSDCAMTINFLSDRLDAVQTPFPKCVQLCQSQHDELNQFMAVDQRRFLPNQHLLMRVTVPSIDRSFFYIARCEALRRCSLVIIALTRYHRSHGNFPERLNQLVEDGLGPLELMDPFNGQELKYLNQGEQVTVYSVGQNLMDDAGSITPGKTIKMLDDGLKLQFRFNNSN